MSKFIISVDYKFSVTKLRTNLHSVLVKRLMEGGKTDFE